ARQEWAAHVPMDGFHLADAELVRLGRRDRKGAPDTFDAAGYAALLGRLREQRDDETVYAPAFERVLEQPVAGALPVPPAARLVVTEGNYLLCGEGAWARVRPLLDEVWFCAPDEDERVRRLVARHVRFGKPYDEAVAWVRRSDERNAALVAATRPSADLVVPASALPEPAADGWAGARGPALSCEQEAREGAGRRGSQRSARPKPSALTWGMTLLATR